MRSVDRRSLEDATNCMALVICSVDSTLFMRSFNAFSEIPIPFPKSQIFRFTH